MLRHHKGASCICAVSTSCLIVRYYMWVILAYDIAFTVNSSLTSDTLKSNFISYCSQRKTEILRETCINTELWYGFYFKANIARNILNILLYRYMYLQYYHICLYLEFIVVYICKAFVIKHYLHFFFFTWCIISYN